MMTTPNPLGSQPPKSGSAGSRPSESHPTGSQPTGSQPTELRLTDWARITLAGARYDFWLDLNSVPGRDRRDLRRELKANLREASAAVGSATALKNLGSLRALASETARDGDLRSRWLAGWVAALSVLAASVVAFLIASLYYSEGVIDSGVDGPVSSSLFPFLWSEIAVDASDGGIAWTASPGPVPLAAAAVTWILVARPWRSLNNG